MNPVEWLLIGIAWEITKRYPISVDEMSDQEYTLWLAASQVVSYPMGWRW